jgi:hypothetical protein
MRKFVASKTFATKKREIELEAVALLDWRRWALGINGQIHSLPTADRMKYVLVRLEIGPLRVQFYADTCDLHDEEGNSFD